MSRAVMVLGFEQVRQAALNLALFEHLKNAEQAEDMRNALLSSFFSAIVARDLAARTRGMNGEEAFIASLFLRLGKHLTIYYFPEEYRKIERQIANKGLNDMGASKAVLGASYVELGAAIAREWRLPDLVVRGIHNSASSNVSAPHTTADHELLLAAFANELSEVLSRGGNNVTGNIEALTARYKRGLDVDADDLRKVVTSSIEKVTQYASILNIKVRNSPLCAGISGSTGKTLPAQDHDSAGMGGDPAVLAVAGEAPAPEGSGDPAMDRRMLLINSISEIATTLMSDYNLNSVLVMILETLYRGIGFSRVLMVVKDAKTRTMQARFGFGEGIDAIIPQFRYSIDNSSDIFIDAASSGREFGVLDTNAPEYHDRVPAWCRQLTAPRAVVLLPIVVNKAVISLIYADSVNASTRVSIEEIKLFATLTKQAALAIQQKSVRR